MLETFGIYAVAALMIGIMLALFIDVLRKNYRYVHAVAKEAAPTVEKKVTVNELQQVYPPYVDCSREVVHVYEADGASESNTLVQKQGA